MNLFAEQYKTFSNKSTPYFSQVHQEKYGLL